MSLPRLKSFDWRVDVKAASDLVPRMAAPSCLVQLTVAPAEGAEADRDVLFEVNKVWPRRHAREMIGSLTPDADIQETLATMLDGLGKIREQLESLVQAA